MGRKICREQYIENLAIYAPEWELVGEYTNARTATEYRHKICGKIVKKTPYNLKAKPFSCSHCNAKRLALTQEEFLRRASKKKDYQVLGEYKNSGSKIRVKHLVCGHGYDQIASVFLHAKEGCPYCIGKTISKRTQMTHQDFLKKVSYRLGEYDVLSTYQGAHQPLTFRHKPCGTIFTTSADNFVRHSGCKVCKYSTGEGTLKQALRSIGIEVEQGNRSVLPFHREIDLLSHQHSIGIEYDGIRYHTVEHYLRDKNRQWTYAYASKYHLWKTEEAAKKGIRLIHVFENEWLEHPQIVLDKLKALFHFSMAERYYARKLNVREVSRQAAQEFLDQNHIQGHGSAPIAIGLYDNDHLLAVQTFSKTRDGDAYELSRYATKLNTQVVGGFSRCLKHFERRYGPSRLVSFADRRWTLPNRNVYLSNGFELASVVPPSYYYVDPKNGPKGVPIIHHKFKYRKAAIAKKHPEVYSPNKTERQMMQEAGYERVYDCGLLRYEKTYK